MESLGRKKPSAISRRFRCVQCRFKASESTLIRVQAERLNKPILSYEEKQRREHNSYALSINTDDNLSCCFEIDTNHSI
jgi:hypothetical protein